MQAERDAARAGEARAVEALKVAYEAAEDWHGSVEWEGREYTQAVLDACDAVLADSQPALDWLAQRERKAIAEWLDSKAEADNGERADIAPWCREQADALRAGKEVGDA
jgi:hypothetical protein